MFHNPHTIRAIIPPKVVHSRQHGAMIKDDEISVYWPCYMGIESKVIMTDKDTRQQIDGTLSIHVTAEVAQYLVVGLFIRFEHEPTRYYKIFDFTSDDGIFGGVPTINARLVRQDMPVQPTNKRSSVDEDDLVVVTDISDEPPPPPDIHRRRWGY